jgi:hypothetical protein
MAIESSPAALRVQTDADAKVHGTIAVMKSPPKNLSGNNHIVGKQSSGTAAILIPIANSEDSGLAKLLRIVSARRVTPIAHITANTSPLRSSVISNKGFKYADAK